MREGRRKKAIKDLKRDINKLLRYAKEVKETFKPTLNSSVGDSYGHGEKINVESTKTTWNKDVEQHEENKLP